MVKAKVKKTAPKIKEALKKKKVSVSVKVSKVKPLKKAAGPKAKKPLAPKPKAVITPKPKKQKVAAAVIPAAVTEPVPPKIETAPLPAKPRQEIPPAIKPQVKTEARPEIKKEIPLPESAPAAAAAKPAEKILKEVELELPVSVKDLAVKLQEKPSVVIKNLMNLGIMAGINQGLDEAQAAKICDKLGFKIKKALDKEELILIQHQEADKPQDLQPRPPIVTFMGHVDHGKTSLLDAIRKTKVAESEHGGITQHIGAYRVSLAHGDISFLDTPGHEAFTAMRSRGAKITDIVVLVVAADDGVMPQTEEAIDHARAADVPIIVALNKIDKPQANPERVKKQLSGLGLVPEDWQGKTITVPVSAKTGAGIDDLLEMILLQAHIMELKANPNRLAQGVVVEARMCKGRGPVSTCLIQNGTLRLNDNIIIGNLSGKARAMFNDRGAPVTAAGPSFAVEVLGIAGVPQAGEPFFVVRDEKQARELAALRLEREKQQQLKAAVKRISLEDLHAQIEEGKIKELKLIIKADVQGSLGAIRETLNKLNVPEIKLSIIHAAVGNINASDAILAVASNALIIGFNVSSDENAKEMIAKEGIDARIYNIIYELANDIKLAVEGMLEPKLKKNFLGRAEVRKVFRLSRAGTVAGCFVSKGKIIRTSQVSLVRNGQVAFEGKLASLKRFKDDVREVAEGFECGMSLAGFTEVQEGDIIEAFEIEKIARKL
jgi:translation initiation factor IF-2